jgi:hypothetical protein
MKIIFYLPLTNTTVILSYFFYTNLVSMACHIRSQVALQGIEFWSNVCDEEVDLQIEAGEAAEMGRPPEHVSRFYAKGALQFIVPILMQTLTKQVTYYILHYQDNLPHSDSICK